ncbi:hypothetical protein AMAG_13529 [Allomyces macrogynus ATCC 38327]|uniref:Uncharacterized protein n=1 Tax=Allomyces macrogynus (strain ATCC 38327) TaxID=578462 RepID=A0A0L0T2C1_ALLM3|nr:hypothetical protein AMAG_13529 [Allomyces macrogynus ATCC 38327]|eukprot:KNE68891.1 hypothetical protein AMAG_13529 [Allomyces macrogynus ATCC 38327]
MARRAASPLILVVLAAVVLALLAAPAALAQSNDDMKKCNDAMVALQNDACLKAFIEAAGAGSSTTSMAMPTLDMNTMGPMIDKVTSNVCTAKCQPGIKSAFKSMFDGCEALFKSSMSSIEGMGNLSPAFMVDTMNFAIDMICSKSPADKSSFCIKEFMAFAQKHPELMAGTSSTSSLSSSSSSRSSSSSSSSSSSMSSAGSGMSIGTLGESFNSTALKSIPKSETCTPCMQLVNQQSVLFMEQKAIPAMSGSASTELKNTTDSAISGYNDICGADYIKKDGTLVFGTSQAQTAAGGSAAGGSGAGKADASVAPLVLLGAVMAVFGMQ